jgi:hypothetical protein
MPRPFNDAGRRLRAAIWSYKRRLASVDEFIADTDPSPTTYSVTSHLLHHRGYHRRHPWGKQLLPQAIRPR